MDVIWWWLFALIAIIVEVITVGQLVSIWLAFGAIGAGIVDLLGAGIEIQFVVFVVVTVVAVLFLRPLTTKMVKSEFVPTNVDRYLGKEVPLTKACSHLLWGELKIGGSTWTCINVGDETLTEGTLVKIVGVEGVKFKVEAIKEKI
jgi:membrane protein implicated in regulation of membrane protease activity